MISMLMSVKDHINPLMPPCPTIRALMVIQPLTGDMEAEFGDFAAKVVISLN